MIEQIATFYQGYPKELIRFVKFSVVGASSTVIDFILFNVALYLFVSVGWNTAGQLPINGALLVANTLSVSIGILNSFTWNRLWTFSESRSQKKRKLLPQFVTVYIIGLLINNLLVVGFDSVLHLYLSEPLNYNVAKLLATGMTLFWNFGANRLWTFRRM